MVALVSHELRTPLTSIRGYLELVGDLLFAAQVEAGKLSVEDGDVDMNRIVEEAVLAARPTAASFSRARRLR